jgi:hypothetical protein
MYFKNESIALLNQAQRRQFSGGSAMALTAKINWIEGVIVTVATLLASIGTSVAADIPPLPAKALVVPAPALQAWTFTLAPYVWMPSLNGSTTVKGRTTDVDVSFVDILDHTKIPKDLFGLMTYLEARNGRYSFFADVVYLKVGLNGDMTRSRGVDALNASVGASAGLKIEMVIAEMAAAYEVARWGSTSGPGSSTAIDLYGGARGWWQKADASVNLGGTVNVGDLTFNPDRTLTASGNVAWADPLVGVRLRQQFAPGMDLVMSGDAGGFGAGSKFSWQALAAFNYKLFVRNDITWNAMIGYKALSVDYSQGSGLNHYEYNMTMSGPIIGLTAQF